MKSCVLCAENKISKGELRKVTGVTFSTFTKLRNNQEVAISILMRIAEALACNLGDMMDFVKDDRTTLSKI